MRTTVPGTVARTVTRAHPAALARRLGGRARDRGARRRDERPPRRGAVRAAGRAGGGRARGAGPGGPDRRRRGTLRAPDGPRTSSRPTSGPSARACTVGRRGCWPTTARSTASSPRTCWPPSRRPTRGRRACSRPRAGARWPRARRTSRCGCCSAPRPPTPASCCCAAPPSSAPARTRWPRSTRPPRPAAPEIVAEAARLAATALVLRSEPEAAAARLRVRAGGRSPAELAGELEDQLVEALAYRDDDAPEYLRRGRARGGRTRAPCAARRVRLSTSRTRARCARRARRATEVRPARSRARRAADRRRALRAASASSASRRCGRSRRCSPSRPRPRRLRRARDVRSRQPLGLARLGRGRGGLDGGALGAALRPPAPRRGPHPPRARAVRRRADPDDGRRQHAGGHPARPRRRGRRPRDRRRRCPDLGTTAAIFGALARSAPACCWPRAAPRRRWPRSTSRTPRTAPAAG